MKHILLTNDDGIFAEGLLHLLKTLKIHCRVTVVAPDEEKSATSLSITTRKPLVVKKVDLLDGVEAFSISGTPADCIKIALSARIMDKPDLIVSGINPGSNAGRNLLYSGTVGGVIEGIIQGIPGIAFSMRSNTHPNFAPALSAANGIVHYLLGHPLPCGTLLNVNFPSVAPYKGLKWTKQGLGYWREDPTLVEEIASGHSLYLLGCQEFSPQHEESDTYWLEKGYGTLVPVKIGELTDHKILEERRELIFGLSKKWVSE